MAGANAADVSLGVLQRAFARDDALPVPTRRKRWKRWARRRCSCAERRQHQDHLSDISRWRPPSWPRKLPRMRTYGRRIGSGFDGPTALVEGRPLVLGGVTIAPRVD